MKLIVTADQHVGHRAGLTPPHHQSGGRKWIRRQAEKWEWFVDAVKKNGPYECHVNLGDIVDGQGIKDHAETILSPNDQISAAIEIVETINAPVNWFVAGTRVHTVTRDGLELDLEVARNVNTNEDPKFHGQIFLNHGDWLMNFRHAPSSKSFVPTTRANPLLKERDSNVRWYLEGREPMCTHYFRGHCHYLFSAGEPNRWAAYAVPALQCPDTKYGRILSSVVHVGFGVLTFGKGWPRWEVIEQPPTKARSLSLLTTKT